MKQIAVITGASSGIGREFAQRLKDYGRDFDEVWVIARRKERLETLDLPWPVKALSLDLTDRTSFATYAELLEKEEARVRLLINCSGFGKFCATMDTDLADNLNMVDLNCQALMAMCQVTIPHMDPGAQIFNIASVAGCQPVPYINVYAASKAFVLHFSRGLNRELRNRGIHVMAICPFWTKTEFFDRAIDEDREKVVKTYIALYTPEQIVTRAFRDGKRKKDISMYGAAAFMQCLLAKILPHSFVMSFWMKQQKL